MNVSPTLMLIIGICAGSLFLIVFAVSTIITIRNRRIIQDYAERCIDRKPERK
ncbi:MAG: hypothetical protein K2G41_04290 [Duncaniella sp.]|uniref:hypothetical protein n=1 Tax=Duncaniella sp. TaxID=2518496 RepID=UPI0023C83A38|nr:hypothetical protein [Duncaniella sp.]MDE6089900.1 hypothetical protein [Duncaniella sp.]